MAKRNKEKTKIPTDGSEALPSNNPFADLLAGRSAPPGELPAEEVDRDEAQEARTQSLPKKVSLRRERKDRGGKTVTIIEGLGGLAPDRLDDLVRDLRKGLGVGATIEDDRVVVQGDLGERVESFLMKSGVQEVRRTK